MTTTVYTPIVGTQYQRYFPLTQDEFNSVLITYGTAIVTTPTLANYALLAGSQTLSGTNVFSGTTKFTAPAQFANLPWADITAYGARNGQDSTTEIQEAIDYMYTVYGGGYVFIPPGEYITSSAGLTVKGGCILLGSGQGAGLINGTNQDATVITFDESCVYAGMYELLVGGYASTLAVNSAVVIANGVPVNMRNSKIVGGNYALYNGGDDGRFYNIFLTGYVGGCVYSTGGNFYTDCKFDSSTGAKYGFYVAPNFSGGIDENYLVNTDLSGNFLNSVHIDCGTTSAFTKLVSCIVSSPVVIVNHTWTAFVSSTFGSNFVGCGNFSGTVATLAGGNIILSGNFNIVS
jgi:hypothetical protein